MLSASKISRALRQQLRWLRLLWLTPIQSVVHPVDIRGKERTGR